MDHSNESDSDTEGVLSDVHIRIRPPESTSEPGRYISRFPLMLSNPAGEERTNNIEAFDDDGDLVLPRHEQPQEVITIIHAMDTPIETVGLQVWRGACLMADFLIHNAHKFDGIYALEANTGFAGIALARVAKRVILTDYSDEILRGTTKNAELNTHLFKHESDKWSVVKSRKLALSTSSTPGDELILLKPHESLLLNSGPWSWTLEDLRDWSKVTVILAADVVYDPELTLALFESLKTMLLGDKVLYLSIEKRINFSLTDMSPSSPAYDYFRTFFDESAAACDEEVPGTTPFIGTRILSHFPQYLPYVRVPQLELWEIRLRSSSGT